MADRPAESSAERDANRLIEQQLCARLTAVEQVAGTDVLSYFGPMAPPADDEIKNAVERLSNAGRRRRAALMVFLETGGGYINVVERIARILRYHYRQVDFVVPSFAMSAGTVLVMAGDDIYMDYASVLGPIDPQLESGDHNLVPALGYLEQYQRLIQKSANGTITTAEVTYLVQRFDPAELYQYEQERELSIALLEDWLVKYKFRNWKVTETSKTKVTAKMRKDRAKEIGEKLNETSRWHSHGRGIPLEVLRRDLKLVVRDFGEDPKLAGPVRDYYHLLRDYQYKRGHRFFALHTKEGYSGY